MSLLLLGISTIGEVGTLALGLVTGSHRFVRERRGTTPSGGELIDLGLAGRTTFVRSSTSGIGEAIARTLAAEGAHTVICGRQGHRAHEIAAALPSAIGVEIDLLTDDGRAKLLAATVETFGAPDVLVLNGRCRSRPQPAASTSPMST